MIELFLLRKYGTLLTYSVAHGPQIVPVGLEPNLFDGDNNGLRGRVVEKDISISEGGPRAVLSGLVDQRAPVLSPQYVDIVRRQGSFVLLPSCTSLVP